GPSPFARDGPCKSGYLSLTLDRKFGPNPTRPGTTTRLPKSESASACEYSTSFYPDLRYAESTLSSKGVWDNTIINGVYYAVQDILDKYNFQSCYSEVRDTRVTQFKGALVAKNPVTASMGVQGYTGQIQIPCRAFYIDRYHAGYATPGENVCHVWFQGTSFTTSLPVDAPLDVSNNFHVLSQNHAYYQWLKVDETNAIKDNWGQNFYPHGSWYLADNGAYYFCRALVMALGWLVKPQNSLILVMLLSMPSPYKA
ncbi:hypothetical protein HDU76_000744, partial [Blyttiomyces sp. JEL0837]